MEKKYIVLVINDPYGRDDGFQTHPASGKVLNNKIYNTLEEAHVDLVNFERESSHKEIESKFNIPYELFTEIRSFILSNGYLNTSGNEPVKNTFSKDKMISIFLNMYNLTVDYDEVKFEKDETLYQRLMGDEPILTIVEIDQ